MGLTYPDETWTWEDVRDVGRKLVATPTPTVNPIVGVSIPVTTTNCSNPLIHALADRSSTASSTSWSISPNQWAAAQFLVDLIHQDRVLPGVTTDGNALFRQGVLGMHVANISDLSSFRETATFDWDVALMPAGPAARGVRLWPDSFAISATSQHVEEAWAYIKFVITQTKMDRYSGAQGKCQSTASWRPRPNGSKRTCGPTR